MDPINQILTRLGIMDTRLESIEKYLEKQNGRLKETESSLTEIDKRLVSIETRCLVVEHNQEKESSQMRSEVKENRNRIIGLIGQYSAIILSVLMLLNMIGGWVGWW
jgi:chromosome segregation ATPase